MTIILTGKDLTIDQIVAIAHHNQPIELAEEAMQKVSLARQTLFDLAATGYPVYGMNRGVGWNKDKEFDPDFFERYNKNLLNVCSLGVPPYCTVPEVRAMMLLRINKALLGSTGISLQIIELFRDFLNLGISPQVPRRGSIGEADITTLPFLGLAVMGEGNCDYQGQTMPTMQAIKACQLELPLLGPKDALSILSCNAHGEAIAALAFKQVADFMQIADLIYCLNLEGLNGGVDPLGEKVNAIRQMPGQIKAAAACRANLKGSYLYQPSSERPLQDPLSFRCAVAIHGAVYDALAYAENFLNIGLNTSDDNPYIDLEQGKTVISSNFEVLSLAQGVEMLAISLAHLSKTIGHRTIKMADPSFTGLGRFLTPKEVEVIAYGTIQKVFSSLDSENRMYANPNSMDFFSLSGYIEDHASNLPLAVDKLLKMLDNLRYMLAIEAMHAAQAIDLRGDIKLGEKTAKAYRAIRQKVPFLDQDRNLSIDINAIYNLILDDELLDL